MILWIILLLVVGLIVPIIGTIIDLKDGIDLTIRSLFQYVGLTLLGPIALVIVAFELVWM